MTIDARSLPLIRPTPPPREPSRLIWEDDFIGASGTKPDPTKWTYMPGFGSETNVELDGESHLKIITRNRTSEAGYGARIGTKLRENAGSALFAVQYGIIEARINVPEAAKEMHPAFWMLGANDFTEHWPRCGEIDVMEYFNTTAGQNRVTLHGGIGKEASEKWEKGVSAVTASRGAFHNYAVFWAPGYLEFQLDGAPYAVITKNAAPPGMPWAFDTGPFYLIIDNIIEAPAATLETTMLVDWVRIYQ